MARPGTVPLLLLCASFLLPTFVFASSADLTLHQESWFDHEIEAKTQRLNASIAGSAQRDELISIALLDEIYSLRESCSDQTPIDATLARLTVDPSIPSDLRSEARYLRELWDKGEAAASDQAALRTLLTSFDPTAAKSDPQVAESIAAIEALHHWHNIAHAERATELNNTTESWYRLSTSGVDAYRHAQSLRHALDLDPGYVPAIVDMARQYAAQGQITRARSMLQAALKQNPNEVSVAAALIEIDINQGHGSNALRKLNQLKSETLSVAVAREVASSYAQLGFLAEARQLAHFALKIHPAGIKEQELVVRLDDRAEEAKSTVNGENEGVSAETALPADGGTERLRRILNGGAVADDTNSRQFFADVPKLITGWRNLPAGERTQSRVLADIRVDQLRPDYQVVQHVQQVIALATSADISAYKNRSIQYSPESQDIAVVRTRVYHADGTTSEADDLGENSVADASVSMYYDLRAREYRFRDLRVGDVIELEYTISPLENENPYGHYFAELVGFGSALRCDLQRYVLRSPSTISVSSVERLMQPPVLHKDTKETVYIWEKSSIPDLVLESRAPSWSEQGAYVHVSNFDSWHDLGKWYADLIRPQFTLNDELQNLVAEIVERHPNRLDRIVAIDELVLKQTRYVALEFGVYGFKPYPAAQTYSRKFGDCKDKATLMVALLRAAGIDADIALVRTHHLGDIISHPASASIFDHAIVYVPAFDLWLDGTAEFARLRELPVEDQGVMALTVDGNGDAVLRRTPTTSASDNYSRRTINARIDDDGTIRFSGATYVRGEDAPGVRRQLEPRDSTLGYVRDHLAQVLPAVQVQDVNMPSGSGDTVSISFSGELTSFRGRHAAALPSSWMPRNYLDSLAATKTRRQDLILEAPWTTEEEIHIQLSGGSNVAALPKDIKITGEFGNASIQYRVDGHEVVVSSTVQFTDTRITVSEYPAFREFVARTEEAFARDIEVALQ